MRRWKALQQAWRAAGEAHPVARGPSHAQGRRGMCAKTAAAEGGAAAEGAAGVKPKPQFVAPETAPVTEQAKLFDTPMLLATALAGVAGYTFYYSFANQDGGIIPKDDESAQTFTNWSGTHEVKAKRVWQPETVEELEKIISGAHDAKLGVRVVGSALSPNGLAFREDGMVSMALLDKVLDVDKATGRVTVQAGARVQDVVEALRPYGLTLQNYASIREQQIGGFTQVGAHGTGAAIPPVDEQVVSMKLVTPKLGTLTLSKEESPELFSMARVGLGAIGVVAEVTLQCVPAHRLLEKTWCTTRAEVEKNHAKWLRNNKHIRYMWIPSTDTVVVVSNNPTRRTTAPSAGGWFGKAPSDDEKLGPMRALLRGKRSEEELPTEELHAMTAFQMRDALIAVAPLDKDWIVAINKAEAEFWKRSEGYRVGWSDELLGFDCGGQQWVLEVAFPCGTLAAPSFRDLDYMRELMTKIEEKGIAAPAPIEQRWTASSASAMSPASAPGAPDTIHSWVGIIKYLPSEDPKVRAEITAAFEEYAMMAEREMMPRYGASWHWAKLEPRAEPAALELQRSQLAARFPLSGYNAVRAELDPHGILSNALLDKALGTPKA